MRPSGVTKHDLHTQSDQSGQTAVEYVLMLALIVSLFSILVFALGRLGLQEKLLQPLKKDFANAYQMGDPQGLPYEKDGGPMRHPRAPSGSGNFRIFTNRKP